MSAYERDPLSEEPMVLSIEIGGTTHFLTHENTVIRTFSQGDGAFDHCAFRLDDEMLIFFQGSPETRAQLAAQGIRQVHHEALDEAAIDFLAEQQNAQFDESFGTTSNRNNV